MQTLTLESKIDGFGFTALHAQPEGPRRGGVVLLQEVFGLDAYMQADAARWSKLGFEVLAPSLFDRAEPGFTAEHDADGLRLGLGYAQALGMDAAVQDVETCVDQLTVRGPAFVAGYCYGGSVAWLCACRIETLAAASCYYGSLIGRHATARLLCPVAVHYGADDAHIAASDAEAVRQAHPDAGVYTYAGAGHGFNNEGAPGYNAAAAELARRRTLELFAANGAG